MNVFDESGALYCETPYHLFVCLPVNGLECVVVAGVLFLDVREVFWKGCSFANFVFVMTGDHGIVKDKSGFGIWR